MPSIDIGQQLEDAAEAGEEGKVSALLAEGADPMLGNSRALRLTAYNGHAKCVRILLTGSDPKVKDSCALRLAAYNGHAECVRMLLPASEPKAMESEALRWAARNGHVECVRMLLPVSNATEMGSESLRFATRHGHIECVRLLLPASGPLCEIDGLLQEAMTAGCAKVAALLIEREPNLLDGVDFSKHLASAREWSHRDLASYLSSIMDQEELSSVAQDVAACGGRRHPSSL